MTRRLSLTAVVATMLAGCASVGPHSVAVDRFDYSSAIAESWKQQTLLNIIKLRYVDLPVFVDVSSVVAGYSLQTGVTVGGTVSSQGTVQGNFGAVNGQAVYTDRPTITYVPMTGEKFLRGLITPIEPRNIFFMLQSGYPADFILALTVESLNGLRNRSVSEGKVRSADPDFPRALQLMREVQVAGGVAMRIEEDKGKGSTAVLFFRRDDLPADIQEKSSEIRRLLKMAPDQERFVLTYAPMRGAPDQLAVNSRSMLQILQAFASYVEVPEQDLGQGNAARVLEGPDGGPGSIGMIHSGREVPAGSFVSVQYRGHWFWVDESDWLMKRALTAVMFFFTLTDTGGPERLPLVTIPAQ